MFNNLIYHKQKQGRIHQIEYAMEAVKQGSATVGLKSKSHAILVALKVCLQCYRKFWSCTEAAHQISEGSHNYCCTCMVF